MITALYNFFYGILAPESAGTNVGSFMYNNISVMGLSTTFVRYLSFLFTLVGISIIIVLCCLFVYKLVRLVGGLFRR